jgi:hypothetical protein
MYEQTDTNKFPEKEKPKRNNIWDETMLTFYPSRIPDPGVKKAPDPGSGSATLIFYFEKLLIEKLKSS